MHAYARRIGVDPPTTCGASELAALQEAHLLAVPFENLDVHAGRTIHLEEGALFDKVVTRGRGGFCYELNGLFCEFLSALGYRVRRVSARVYGEGGRLGPEHDHLALLVDCEGTWLVDVGFGDAFIHPLSADSSDFVRQRNGAHRISFAEDGIIYSREQDGEWRDQYRFTPQARAWSDFDAMCVYHSTSPESHFTQKRVVSKLTPEGRVTLRDDRRIHTVDGVLTETPLADAQSWSSALAEDFGLIL